MSTDQIARNLGFAGMQVGLEKFKETVQNKLYRVKAQAADIKKMFYNNPDEQRLESESTGKVQMLDWVLSEVDVLLKIVTDKASEKVFYRNGLEVLADKEVYEAVDNGSDEVIVKNKKDKSSVRLSFHYDGTLVTGGSGDKILVTAGINGLPAVFVQGKKHS